MVVRRRLRETELAGELGERGVALSQAAEKREPLRVAERASERHHPLVCSSVVNPRGVADDPRHLVLAEEELRPRGEMRHEDDALEAGLGLVAVAAGCPVDEVVAAIWPACVGVGSQLGDKVEFTWREGGALVTNERVENQLPGLVRAEGEEGRERFAGPARVVAGGLEKCPPRLRVTARSPPERLDA